MISRHNIEHHRHIYRKNRNVIAPILLSLCLAGEGVLGYCVPVQAAGNATVTVYYNYSSFSGISGFSGNAALAPYEYKPSETIEGQSGSYVDVTLPAPVLSTYNDGGTDYYFSGYKYSDTFYPEGYTLKLMADSMSPVYTLEPVYLSTANHSFINFYDEESLTPSSTLAVPNREGTSLTYDCTITAEGSSVEGKTLLGWTLEYAFCTEAGASPFSPDDASPNVLVPDFAEATLPLTKASTPKSYSFTSLARNYEVNGLYNQGGFAIDEDQNVVLFQTGDTITGIPYTLKEIVFTAQYGYLHTIELYYMNSANEDVRYTLPTGSVSSPLSVTDYNYVDTIVSSKQSADFESAANFSLLTPTIDSSYSNYSFLGWQVYSDNESATQDYAVDTEENLPKSLYTILDNTDLTFAKATDFAALSYSTNNPDPSLDKQYRIITLVPIFYQNAGVTLSYDPGEGEFISLPASVSDTQTDKSDNEFSLQIPTTVPKKENAAFSYWTLDYTIGETAYSDKLYPGETLTWDFLLAASIFGLNDENVIELPLAAVYTDLHSGYVTYDLGGGTMDELPFDEQFDQESATDLTFSVTLPTKVPTKADCYFGGWKLTSRNNVTITDSNNTDGVYAPGKTAVITYDTEVDSTDIIFEAVWNSGKTAMLSINWDGGNSVTGLSDTTYTQENASDTSFSIELPSVSPQKDGAFFNGYTVFVNDVEDTSHTYMPGDTVLLNYGESDFSLVVIKALWTNAKSATVTFIPNGGTLADSENKKLTFSQQNSTENTYQVTLQATPTKEGYTFTGWKCNVDNAIYEAGQTITLSYADSSSVRISAQWKANADTSTPSPSPSTTITPTESPVASPSPSPSVSPSVSPSATAAGSGTPKPSRTPHIIYTVDPSMTPVASANPNGPVVTVTVSGSPTVIPTYMITTSPTGELTARPSGAPTTSPIVIYSSATPFISSSSTPTPREELLVEVEDEDEDENEGPEEAGPTGTPAVTTITARGTTVRLSPGVCYHLGKGEWHVSGDSTTYFGGNAFYVSTDGDYNFN